MLRAVGMRSPLDHDGEKSNTKEIYKKSELERQQDQSLQPYWESWYGKWLEIVKKKLIEFPISISNQLGQMPCIYALKQAQFNFKQ